MEFEHVWRQHEDISDDRLHWGRLFCLRHRAPAWFFISLRFIKAADVSLNADSRLYNSSSSGLRPSQRKSVSDPPPPPDVITGFPPMSASAIENILDRVSGSVNRVRILLNSSLRIWFVSDSLWFSSLNDQSSL